MPGPPSTAGGHCSTPGSWSRFRRTTARSRRAALDEFVERQRNYFATGRRISERLENVRVDMGRRIARVSADFIFVDEGEERPGKLGLHLAQGRDGWKIVAVLFAYDVAP